MNKVKILDLVYGICVFLCLFPLIPVGGDGMLGLFAVITVPVLLVITVFYNGLRRRMVAKNFPADVPQAKNPLANTVATNLILLAPIYGVISLFSGNFVCKKLGFISTEYIVNNYDCWTIFEFSMIGLYILLCISLYIFYKFKK